MKLFTLVITLITVLTSCAQTRFQVAKSYGFLRQNSKGALAVDDNNNPVNPGPDSQYVAYVELPSSINPRFTTAWINQQTFNIFADKVNAPMVVGTKLANTEAVKLSTQPGDSLWQLNLQKGEREAVPSAYASSNTPNQIIVKGIIGKKPFYFTINSITQLDQVIYP